MAGLRLLGAVQTARGRRKAALHSLCCDHGTRFASRRHSASALRSPRAPMQASRAPLAARRSRAVAHAPSRPHTARAGRRGIHHLGRLSLIAALFIFCAGQVAKKHLPTNTPHSGCSSPEIFCQFRWQKISAKSTTRCSEPLRGGLLETRNRNKVIDWRPVSCHTTKTRKSPKVNVQTAGPRGICARRRLWPSSAI